MAMVRLVSWYMICYALAAMYYVVEKKYCGRAVYHDCDNKSLTRIHVRWLNNQVRHVAEMACRMWP